MFGMTLEEAEKISGVSAHWLRNIDEWVPGADGKQLDYYWITKVAEALELPGSQLRAALARQEIPAKTKNNGGNGGK